MNRNYWSCHFRKKLLKFLQGGWGGCLGLGLKGLLYGDATNGIMNSDHMGVPPPEQTDRQTGLKIIPSPLSFPKQGKKGNF